MQTFQKIDPNEFPDSFASRTKLAGEYASWLSTLNFQFHVTANFNRETTYEHGTAMLKQWSSRLDRKLYGGRYYKKQAEDRTFFIAVPETSGASQNLHYHMLLRLPHAKHGLFENSAELIWREFNPTGSLYIQRIPDTEEDRKKVIGYDLKDGWKKHSLDNIVISTVFSNG